MCGDGAVTKLHDPKDGWIEREREREREREARAGGVLGRDHLRSYFTVRHAQSAAVQELLCEPPPPPPLKC